MQCFAPKRASPSLKFLLPELKTPSSGTGPWLPEDSSLRPSRSPFMIKSLAALPTLRFFLHFEPYLRSLHSLSMALSSSLLFWINLKNFSRSRTNASSRSRSMSFTFVLPLQHFSIEISMISAVASSRSLYALTSWLGFLLKSVYALGVTTSLRCFDGVHAGIEVAYPRRERVKIAISRSRDIDGVLLPNLESIVTIECR